MAVRSSGKLCSLLHSQGLRRRGVAIGPRKRDRVPHSGAEPVRYIAHIVPTVNIDEGDGCHAPSIRRKPWTGSRSGSAVTTNVSTKCRSGDTALTMATSFMRQFDSRAKHLRIYQLYGSYLFKRFFCRFHNGCTREIGHPELLVTTNLFSTVVEGHHRLTE